MIFICPKNPERTHWLVLGRDGATFHFCEVCGASRKVSPAKLRGHVAAMTGDDYDANEASGEFEVGDGP